MTGGFALGLLGYDEPTLAVFSIAESVGLAVPVAWFVLGFTGLFTMTLPSRRVGPTVRRVTMRPSTEQRLLGEQAAPGSGTRSRPVAAMARIGEAAVSKIPMLDGLPSPRIGSAVVVGALLLPWFPFVACLAMGVILVTGWNQARLLRRSRQRANDTEMAFFAAMLAQALRSGLTTRQSVFLLSEFAHGDVALALTKIGVRLDRGERVVDSLAPLRGVSASADALVAALKSAEGSGVSLASSIARISDAMSTELGLAAQERARQLPVKMLLPLAAFFLPAFVLIAVVPVFVVGLHGFSFP